MQKEHKKELTYLAALAAAFVLTAAFSHGTAKKVLCLLVYIASAYEIIFGAVKGLCKKDFLDERFLMSAASIGALCLGEFSEGIMVILLYRFGELFGDIAVYRSHASVEELMNLAPEFARTLRGGKELKLSPEQVAPGETLRILAGERIPLDGTLLSGETTVDTSSLTGESLPVVKCAGDEVLGGSINLTGTITVKVTKPYAESTVSKILNMIKTSAEKKSKTERFVTRFSQIYTPAVVASAVFIALVPSILSPMNYAKYIKSALMFLVVSCPCALVISVPITFIGAMGIASRRGILVKGAVCIENLARCAVVAFDKTGTVTEGRFGIKEIIPNGISKEELLFKAAACESFSNHPIALSVTEAYGKPVDIECERQTELVGRGICLETASGELCAGNARLMREKGIAVTAPATQTVVYIAENGRFLGCITLEDKVRPAAASFVPRLKSLGVKKCVMLTGDTKESAKAVARLVSPDEVHCELLPADKVCAVEKLMENNNRATLCYIGDGINDAPVIMRADIGAAMGVIGSDAAIEAADAVITNDNLNLLCEAISLSKTAVRTVYQNVAFILAVKFSVMLLSMTKYQNMWFAIFADVGVMLLSVINALLIGAKHKKIK